MTVEARLEKIINIYEGSKTDAAGILKDQAMAQQVLADAIIRAEELTNQLPSVKDTINTMLELTADYLSGEYDQASFDVMVKIMAAIIYMMIPLDVLPDFIPPMGFIDDALIIGLVASEETESLQQYIKWKDR